MLRKGLAVAAILLFIGLALTPSINGDVSKSSLEPSPDIVVLEEDNVNPIVLVFQLIANLRNNKDIQNIESEDDVLRIIEGDDELNSIVEQLFAYDCDCDEESSALDWSFPITCILLFPLYIITFVILVFTGLALPNMILAVFGYQMNCFRAPDI